MGGQVGGSSPWEEGGGNLQTDAEQLFLFVPIPAKAKKLGLLSIYKFSLGLSYRPARLHRLAEFLPWNQFRGPINI
jgi:hypothetical protein